MNADGQNSNQSEWSPTETEQFPSKLFREAFPEILFPYPCSSAKKAGKKLQEVVDEQN